MREYKIGDIVKVKDLKWLNESVRIKQLWTGTFKVTTKPLCTFIDMSKFEGLFVNSNEINGHIGTLSLTGAINDLALVELAMPDIYED